MDNRELEVMRNYYYGESKAIMIWNEEIELLDINNNIKKIYEIYNKEYNETWYLIRDKKDASYILKNRCGNEYARDIMKKYKNKYIFNYLTSDIIEKYDSGYYPIVFKINFDEFNELYDSSNNINNAFFNNYYAFDGERYRCIREYRNKVEIEEFLNELDAIYWCYHIKLSKKSVLNISKNKNIFNCIYEISFERRINNE